MMLVSMSLTYQSNSEAPTPSERKVVPTSVKYGTASIDSSKMFMGGANRRADVESALIAAWAGSAFSLTQPAENTNEPLQSGRQTVFLRLPRRSNHLVINTHSVLIAGVFFALFP